MVPAKGLEPLRPARTSVLKTVASAIPPSGHGRLLPPCYQNRKECYQMPENVIDASPQREKFIAAARALDCNEDEAAFKRSLRAIAKAPVEKKTVKR